MGLKNPLRDHPRGAGSDRARSGIMTLFFLIGTPSVNLPAGSMLFAPARLLRLPHQLLLAVLLCLALDCAASDPEPSLALQALSTERELIAAELTQIQKTLALLQGTARPGTGNSSAAVKSATFCNRPEGSPGRRRGRCAGRGRRPASTRRGLR